jgi:hypothetical protein
MSFGKSKQQFSCLVRQRKREEGSKSEVLYTVRDASPALSHEGINVSFVGGRYQVGQAYVYFKTWLRE